MADAHAAVLLGDALAVGAEGVLGACLFCQACGALVPEPSPGRAAEVDQLECVLTCDAVTASDAVATGFCSPLATACAACGSRVSTGSACTGCGAVAAAREPAVASTEPSLVGLLSASLAAVRSESSARPSRAPEGAAREEPGALPLAASALRAAGASQRASLALRQCRAQAGPLRARLTSRCVVCSQHGRAGILAKPCSSLLGPTLIRPSLTAGLPPQRWWSKRWAAPAHLPRLALLRLAPAGPLSSCDWAPPGADAAPSAPAAAAAVRAQQLSEWADCGLTQGAGSAAACTSRDVAPLARLAMVAACSRLARRLVAGGSAAAHRRPAAGDAEAEAGAEAAAAAEAAAEVACPAQTSVVLPVLALIAVDLRACGRRRVSVAPATGVPEAGTVPEALVFTRVVRAGLQVNAVAGGAAGGGALCEARLPLVLSVALGAGALEGLADAEALAGGWSRWKRTQQTAGAGASLASRASEAGEGGAAADSLMLQVLVTPAVACEVPLA